MTQIPRQHSEERRHSRWYERLLLHPALHLVLGSCLVVAAPALIRWLPEGGIHPIEAYQLNTLVVNLACFLATFQIIRRLRRIPGTQGILYVAPVPVLLWLTGVALLFFLREPYSRQVLLSSFMLACCWFLTAYLAGGRFRHPKLAVVPYGRAQHALSPVVQEKHATCRMLSQPSLSGGRYDAVVADLHADDLPSEWERFIARCILSRIPVFHHKQVVESLTGRVEINHLAENDLGHLLPSGFTLTCKRLLDFIAALILLPLLFPVMLLTGIMIRLESGGPVIFVQQRMGYRGVPFNVYKFRSMYHGVPGKDYTEGHHDVRITRVGRFIRKYRLDELPQLINILKGEMSFIGPRPESMALSQRYEQEVPFFSYRHVVRPGISGWAQVNQGYAAELDGMTRKLQYDFYYIKHISIWLDVLILFKTIRTVITGFGAR